MPKQNILQVREEEIGKLVHFLSEQSSGFLEPRLILIGGYALRAFIPRARYSRDCDFVLQSGLDTVNSWLPKTMSVDALETFESHSFMRWISFLRDSKKKVKIAVDFMEGEVRGRAEQEIFKIDEAFMASSELVEVTIGSQTLSVFVPSYVDFFIMKLMSARRSDTRDIAAMVWDRGVPLGVLKHAKELMPHPRVLETNLREKILPDISNKLFLDSWRGTFITTEFEEKDKRNVIAELKKLLKK